MAIIHKAYSFDPMPFHVMLDEKTVEHGSLRRDVLHDWATTIVANASATTWQALKDMRFDHEWLDTSDDSVSRTDVWYMIVLAQTLSPAPSLSNRLEVSWEVLQRALPLAGWTPSDVRLLVRGKWLRTLVESSGNALFVAEFSAIDQFGGWLSVDDAKLLLSRLLADEESFRSPPTKLVNALLDFAKLWSQSPMEMIGEAYADAIEMLQISVKRNNALFIILD